MMTVSGYVVPAPVKLPPSYSFHPHIVLHVAHPRHPRGADFGATALVAARHGAVKSGWLMTPW